MVIGPRLRLRSGLVTVDEATHRDALLRPVDWFRLPAGAAPRTFEVPSGRLAGFSLGDAGAPRMLLIPGATGSKEDFLLLAPLLVAAGLRVDSVDLAGQYESAAAGPGMGGRYDYPLFVDDLVAVLRQGGPAHLLGYSFAGILAQLVAVEHPELVRSLTLLTTPPTAGNSLARVRYIGALARVGSARLAASLMIWGIVTNKNRVDERRLEFVQSRFALTQRSSVDDIVGLMMDVPDVREQLRVLRIPSLVAVGVHDLWPLTAHAKFAEGIGAELAVYRTGHSPGETAPHQLARDMIALIGRGRA